MPEEPPLEHIDTIFTSSPSGAPSDRLASSSSSPFTLAPSTQIEKFAPSVAHAQAFIELKPLKTTERRLYQSIADMEYSGHSEGESESPGKVVHLYRDPETGTRWYYVQDGDGIAHRFEAREFESNFPSQVADYERKKRDRELPPFDPSATYVHPKSRVKIVINMAKLSRRVKRSDGSSRDQALDVHSEEEWDDDVPEGSDEENSFGGSATPGPSRRTRRITKGLPFSPRKTRSRKSRNLRDTDEEDEEDTDESPSELTRGTRRSTRQRKAVRDYVADEDYEESGSDDGSDEYQEDKAGRSKVKERQPVRGKASRPAYGHIRSIVDLDYDPYHDEDTAALRTHRDTCEKCSRPPTHVLLEKEAKKLKKGQGRKKRKRQNSEDGSDEEEEQLASLGGWVRCLKCPLSAHWRCLASTQRDEILKAVQDRDYATWAASQGLSAPEDGVITPAARRLGPSKRPGLETQQTTEFICSMCMKGGICMGCEEVALQPEVSAQKKALVDGKTPPIGEPARNSLAPTIANKTPPQDIPGTQAAAASSSKPQQGTPTPDTPAKELLFRCKVCKRLAHYAHLPVPDGLEHGTDDAAARALIADYYQYTTNWSCAECASYDESYRVEKILAWRSYPVNAEQPVFSAGDPPNVKVQLPREYLVKWINRSYRRTRWVHHGWLAAIHPGLLKHFLASGPRVDLLKEAVKEEEVANAEAEGGVGPNEEEEPKGRSKDFSLLSASPDAERKIPPAWKTVDRVLEVLMWRHRKRQHKSSKGKGKSTAYRKVESDDDEEDDEGQEEWNAAFDLGEQPSDAFTEDLSDWERKERNLTMDDIGSVVWAFIKWDDLSYEEATWDSPPRPGEPGYPAFKIAFQRFLDSRLIHVPARTKREQEAMDKRVIDGFFKHRLKNEDDQPKLGQSEQSRLMPFQVDGFNWLCDNWWNHQPCILADEMGLGKTVQIAAFVGSIVDKFKAFPALVVVPNSTITNWVREFARWAPRLRVVPFYGEAKSREIIKRYELSHNIKEPGTTGAKFHVLVTTYETLNVARDFTSVFKSVPRWEVLIVDEGQRLKNDSSLLFRKLNELRIGHRIIMTGTPLNNNIRELFNLMNFLDPEKWSDLEQLEKEHEELTEDLVKDLHIRLKPYFLRRVKSQVLQLPPKNEVIVPVSLTPLQKEVYKSILSRNINILMDLTKSLTQSKTRAGSGLKAGSMVNILMELRKCIQHPYLVSDDIEPKGLGEREAHDRLVAGSAKLRLLQSLLPKLKARGHRVLLFSQFVIALNIVEDFLIGEGIKYLRLDGNTKQADRQKGMDEFNRPGSDVFIYLLTTRAGGVGINLWSADTVIIFDPDFNPHQDLQAIARAHRYGQTKPCLVFKLMAKDTAEERIIQTGKKKLILDHVIVQKMDDKESGTDVQSILTFGAKAMFEEDSNARDIVYHDHDVDNLIKRTETEGEQEEQPAATGLTFSFAKVWAADKDDLEEVPDELEGPAEVADSWAQTLERIASERNKERAKEVSGRGVRRKAAAAAAVKPQQSIFLDETPTKDKAKGKKRKVSKASSDESEGYHEQGSTLNSANSENSGLGSASDDLVSEMKKHSQTKPAHPSSPSPASPASPATGPSISAQPKPNGKHVQPSTNGQRDAMPGAQLCGLCGTVHSGPCFMTENSENLAEYRRILFFETAAEPVADRRAAIEIIDSTLNQRGDLHLIYGQPLRLTDPVHTPRPPQMPTAMANGGPPPRPTGHTAVKRTPHISTGGSFPKPPSATFPTNGHSGASQFGPSNIYFPAPSPSKRPGPPLPEDQQRKKVRAEDFGCAICGVHPFHLIKDCPVVAEGPGSISRAIVHLSEKAEHRGVVDVLQKILAKQKKQSSVNVSRA